MNNPLPAYPHTHVYSFLPKIFTPITMYSTTTTTTIIKIWIWIFGPYIAILLEPIFHFALHVMIKAIKKLKSSRYQCHKLMCFFFIFLVYNRKFYALFSHLLFFDCILWRSCSTSLPPTIPTSIVYMRFSVCVCVSVKMYIYGPYVNWFLCMLYYHYLNICIQLTTIFANLNLIL